MRFVSCLLLLWLAPAVFAQTAGAPGDEQAADTAWDTLSACAALEQSSSESLEALEADCPGFSQALEDLGYTELLPGRSDSALTRDQIVDLERIARRYREAPGTSIDEAALDDVLETLGKETTQAQPTLWERFRAWLRELFGRQVDEKENPWLARWLDKLDVSQMFLRIVYWSLVALVVAMALGVVINEVRAAGLFRRWRAPASEPGAALSRSIAEAVSLADLERLPLEDRPSVLLRVLIATLTKTGRLSSAKSLTHRELASRARFDVADQRDTFHRVANLAERILYGNAAVPPAEIEQIVEQGRHLDVGLRGATT